MGIVKKVLSEFTLSDGTYFRIELNKGQQIHIHMDNLKIQMSIEEFAELVNATANAEHKLKSLKNIHE